MLTRTLGEMLPEKLEIIKKTAEQEQFQKEFDKSPEGMFTKLYNANDIVEIEGTILSQLGNPDSIFCRKLDKESHGVNASWILDIAVLRCIGRLWVSRKDAMKLAQRLRIAWSGYNSQYEQLFWIRTPEGIPCLKAGRIASEVTKKVGSFPSPDPRKPERTIRVNVVRQRVVEEISFYKLMPEFDEKEGFDWTIKAVSIEEELA